MRRDRRKLGRKSKALTRPGLGTDRAPRKPSGRSEPIPDLWEVPGTKLPGNPKFTDHEPEYTYLVDVRGERVCVVKSKVTQFRARSIGIEKLHKVRRPQKVPALWSGQRHHCLTHALRLLQVNSMTFEGQHRNREERQLRGSIQPRQLLEGCGASRALADSLLNQLVEVGLLRCQENKSGACWFVNTRIRGFGPDMHKFTGSQLGESCVLPEFVDSTQTTPEKVSTETKEVESTMSQSAPGKKRVKRTDEGHRQSLQMALDTIRSLVPDDAEVDENGTVVFSFQGGIKDMLVERLGCSSAQASKLLTELKACGLTKRLYVNHGTSKRQVTLYGDVTLEMVRKIRETHAASVARYDARKRAPVEAEASPPHEEQTSLAEETGQVTDMDSFMAKVRQRFEDYERRIGIFEYTLNERNEEIARLKAELDSRPSTVEVVIPDDLAKYLDNN